MGLFRRGKEGKCRFGGNYRTTFRFPSFPSFDTSRPLLLPRHLLEHARKLRPSILRTVSSLWPRASMPAVRRDSRSHPPDPWGTMCPAVEIGAEDDVVRAGGVDEVVDLVEDVVDGRTAVG